jgi:hypothetical protein
VHNRRELFEKRRLALEDFHKKVEIFQKEIPEGLETARGDNQIEKTKKPLIKLQEF